MSSSDTSHVPAPPSGPQRRHLAILFCDLCHSTRLATAMEAEEFGDLLAALRELQQEVVPRHGGLIARLQGDGLLAIFGHPLAGEDDGRRATEAALELHQRIGEIGVACEPRFHRDLALHSGIHAGLVLVETGDLVRGRVDLLGDAANVAARLSDLAVRNEILVSEASLGPERSFFVTESLGAVPLQGRAEPVHVLRVLGRAAVATRFEARLERAGVPFFGREAELGVLAQALARSLAGAPTPVAVSAAPGMGKTRLVRQHLALARGQGARVLQGYCESYLSAEPLQPFRQMLRQLFGVDAETTAQQATLRVEAALNALDPGLLPLGPGLVQAMTSASAAAPDDRGAPPQPPPPIGKAVATLLQALAERGPLVLFVDDWQWADGASVQVLDRLLALPAVRLQVLVTTRPFDEGEAQLGALQVLPLGPLDEQAASAAITTMLPGTDPFLAGEIIRHSGGNPLFMEELCHEAARGGMASWQPPGGTAWLDSLIESRVSRLPARLIEVLRVAAIIGTVVPEALLRGVAEVADGDPVLAELSAKDLLFPAESSGALRFKHGITREVVYQAIGLRQRREWHHQVAAALQQQAGDSGVDDICEMLAYHFGASGRHDEAARFAELAGDKALAVSALDRAQLQYRAALDALDHLDPSPTVAARWNAIAQRLGLVCVFDPARDQLPTMLRALQLARLQGNEASLARAEYWLGYIQYALGESRAAIGHAQRALESAQRVDDNPLVVQVKATLGQAHAAAGHYPLALDLLESAIAVKQQHRSGSRPAVGTAYSLACKGAVLGDQGRFEDALACFDEGMHAVRGARHEVEGSVLCWRAGVLLWQGRWAEALQAAGAAQAVAQRVHSRYVNAMSTSLGAFASWRLHGQCENVQRLVEATAWMQGGDRWLFISLCHGWLAEMRVEQGRGGEARRPLALALGRARGDDRLGLGMACRAMAWAVAAAPGDRQVSRRAGSNLPGSHYLGLADRVAERRSSPHERANNRWCRARVASALGDRPQARDLAEQAMAAFDRLGMAWHAAQCRALLGTL